MQSPQTQKAHELFTSMAKHFEATTPKPGRIHYEMMNKLFSVSEASDFAKWVDELKPANKERVLFHFFSCITAPAIVPTEEDSHASRRLGYNHAAALDPKSFSKIIAKCIVHLRVKNEMTQKHEARLIYYLKNYPCKYAEIMDHFVGHPIPTLLCVELFKKACFPSEYIPSILKGIYNIGVPDYEKIFEIFRDVQHQETRNFISEARKNPFVFQLVISFAKELENHCAGKSNPRNFDAPINRLCSTLETMSYTNMILRDGGWALSHIRANGIVLLKLIERNLTTGFREHLVNYIEVAEGFSEPEPVVYLLNSTPILQDREICERICNCIEDTGSPIYLINYMEVRGLTFNLERHRMVFAAVLADVLNHLAYHPEDDDDDDDDDAVKYTESTLQRLLALVERPPGFVFTPFTDADFEFIDAGIPNNIQVANHKFNEILCFAFPLRIQQ